MKNLKRNIYVSLKYLDILKSYGARVYYNVIKKIWI